MANYNELDGWIPLSELEKIETAYDSKNELLPDILKEVHDKYNFRYSGWLYDSSFEELFQNIQNASIPYFADSKNFDASLDSIKNDNIESDLKWYHLLNLAAEEILKQDGMIVKTLYPSGGEDYSCLIFKNKKIIKPIVILYHFADAVNNASGWYDEFTSSYNVSYEDYLANNNLENDIVQSALEFSREDSDFGTTIKSNRWYLNITREIYTFAIVGMLAAKKFC